MSTEAHHFATQAEFSSSMPTQGSPATEFRLRPDVQYLVKFYNRRLTFPDGAEHEIWGFEDGVSGRGLPGPTLRVAEGQVFHATLKSSKAAHTIHWHGIEPDPRNDGVGHTSFEVTGGYTYQWRPQRSVPGDADQGMAGTYFYHCHVNTVLHAQMGLFGALVVDPVVHPAYPVPAGTRRPFVDGPPYDIATEQLIAPYAVDPRWHKMSHAAGLSGEDVGLNRFEPSHFYLLGGVVTERRTNAGVWSVSRVVAKGSGHPTLLRVLNSSYVPTRLRFTEAAGRPVAMAEPISHDGRAFRNTANPLGPSKPVRDVTGPLLTSLLSFGGAERFDLILHPPAGVALRAHVDFLDWRTGKVLRTLTVPVVVV